MRRHRLLVTATSAAALVAMLSLVTGVSVLSSKNRQLQTAHQLVSTSNQELLAANDRERAAKQLAEDRLELALDAIEKYSLPVSATHPRWPPCTFCPSNGKRQKRKSEVAVELPYRWTLSRLIRVSASSPRQV